MPSFSLPLTVTKLPTNKWKVEVAFRYYTGWNDPIYIEVPEGFITDFASVPWGLRNLFPKDGLYAQAAVVHDYLYTEHLIPRDKADRIFLEAMAVLRVPSYKRFIMYWSVRLFGGLAWNN